MIQHEENITWDEFNRLYPDVIHIMDMIPAEGKMYNGDPNYFYERFYFLPNQNSVLSISAIDDIDKSVMWSRITLTSDEVIDYVKSLSLDDDLFRFVIDERFNE